MTESDEWREGLLLCLLWEDGWTSLVEAVDKATAVAASRWKTRELAYATQRNIKGRMIKEGLLDQRKYGGHYQLRLTEQGEVEAEKIGEPEDRAEEEVPDLPFRFGGSDHRLPKRQFGELMKRVNAGEVELIAVKKKMRTRRVPYWNE
jgi:hypothetical protein